MAKHPSYRKSESKLFSADVIYAMVNGKNGIITLLLLLLLLLLDEDDDDDAR